MKEEEEEAEVEKTWQEVLFINSVFQWTLSQHTHSDTLVSTYLFSCFSYHRHHHHMSSPVTLSHTELCLILLQLSVMLHYNAMHSDGNYSRFLTELKLCV